MKNLKGKSSKIFYEILKKNKATPTSELKWEKVFPELYDEQSYQYYLTPNNSEIKLRNLRKRGSRKVHNV